MQRKTVVLSPVGKAIRSFGLTREVLIDLLAHIHEDIAPKHGSINYARAKNNRHFEYRFAVTEKAGTGHLFVFEIDDTTSQEHLFIIEIRHQVV